MYIEARENGGLEQPLMQFLQHHLMLILLAARILLMPSIHILYHHGIDRLSHGLVHRLVHVHKLFRFIPDSLMLVSLVVFDVVSESHTHE